jgi:hypothetical protein
MSVEERVDLLENSEQLAQVHASAANEGQTEVRSIGIHDICLTDI